MAFNPENSDYEERLNQVVEKLRNTSDSNSTLSFKKDADTNGNQYHNSVSMAYTKAVIGQPAPYFEGVIVHDGVFKSVTSTDFLGKYLVLMFYPLDFTFVCPTELISFSKNLSKFKNLNTSVIACSTDSKFTHLAWLETRREQGGIQGVKLPLLSDLNHKISKDYGIYSAKLGHVYRGLFIIDYHGIIRQITINDLPVGRNVNEILRLIEAFQHTDTHGEVCPAGWEPGDDTIIPDSGGAKKYFQRQMKK